MLFIGGRWLALSAHTQEVVRIHECEPEKKIHKCAGEKNTLNMQALNTNVSPSSALCFGGLTQF